MDSNDTGSLVCLVAERVPGIARRISERRASTGRRRKQPQLARSVNLSDSFIEGFRVILWPDDTCRGFVDCPVIHGLWLEALSNDRVRVTTTSGGPLKISM